MNTLTDQDFNMLRSKLEEEKAGLEHRLTELKVQDPFNDPERLVDNASTDTEANEESTHDRYAAMTRELTLKINDISTTLTAITDGTYGKCASCGKSIGADRLAAIPTAKFCVACGSKR